MEKLKYFLLITILLLTSLSIFSAEDEVFYIESITLHIKISELQESRDPFVHGEFVVFTYKPSKMKVRHVGIAFENESFSQIHSLYKNENGVYFFLYTYPDIDEINYRFIEDGVWIAKSDTNYNYDKFVTLSSFKIPKSKIKELKSPVIEGSKVTFKHRSHNGNMVYLTGDFNGWNPFLYKMQESDDGVFTIDINLPKGKYGYYYIDNGEIKQDSENFERGYSLLGEEVSLFTIN